MRKSIFLIVRYNTRRILAIAILIILMFSVIYNVSQPLAASVFGPLKKRVIVIDPGHGGIDGGANCPGFLEKDVNLAIAKEIKKRLQKTGARVVLTREEDISLEELAQTISRQRQDLISRVKIISKSNPDLFLSIHVNANPRRPSTTGPMVFFNRRIPGSYRLAETIQNNLNQIAAANGFRKHVASPANFYILKNSQCPGAIVEVGFMTNYVEKCKLEKIGYQKQLAAEIAKSIQQYFTKNPNDHFSDKPRATVTSTTDKSIRVYFPKINEDSLTPVYLPDHQPVTTGNKLNHVKEALAALIAGPPDNQFEPVFSNKVKVLGVNINDGIAVIKFSKEIASFPQGSYQEVLALNALVETVCQFPGINGVKILIDEQGSLTLGAHLDISRVLVSQHPKLRAAIVIDDLGSSNKGLKELLEISRPLTMAVLPKHPATRETAELVHKKGYQVFLHLPMEPETGKASWLGEGAIVSKMTPEEAAKQVMDDLADVPYVIGMNNHMGSKITKRKDLMLEILKIAKSKKIVFLDSRTTEDTVIPEVAKQLNMPILQRSVFLDDINSYSHVRRQISKLADLVKQNGSAIAIGHVGITGKNTSHALCEMVPWLEEQGIELVFASQLLSE